MKTFCVAHFLLIHKQTDQLNLFLVAPYIYIMKRFVIISFSKIFLKHGKIVRKTKNKKISFLHLL